MDLNIHDVIIRPRVTTKAQRLNKDEHQLVLEVHPQANKSMIARALKILFNAEASKIGIVSVQGKRRRASKRHNFSVGKRRKKAIIMLKPGSDLEMAQWSSTPHNDMNVTTKN